MHIAISDLHLSGDRPWLLSAFQRLCMALPGETRALWILGDLFDFWIGDDMPDASAEGVIKGLRPLHERGVSVHFIPGNRDFLVGPDFARQAGLHIHTDGKLLVINGRPTWLVHGDHLCIDDAAYMQFRRQVRNPRWQADFLGRSPDERLAIAREARSASSTENASKPEDIMDVNPGYTLSQTSAHGATDLIHGHTHRPAVHPLGDEGSRYVLGDWRRETAVICQWSNQQAPVLRKLHYAADMASLGTPL